MFVHKSRLAGAVAAARLLEDDFEGVEDFFDFFDTPKPIQGPPLTGYYERLLAHMNRRRRRKVGNNTYLSLNEDSSIDLRYHATDILHIEPDGTVSINFGEYDYKTKTTIERLNEFLPAGYRISRKYKRGRTVPRPYGTSGDWYYGQEEYTFWNVEGMQHHPAFTVIQPAETGDTIRPDGLLITKEPPQYKKNRR